MSDIYTSDPGTVRETKLATDSVLTGMDAARKQAGGNIAGALAVAVSSVHVAAAERDASQPRRFRYELAYKNLRQAAYNYFCHFKEEPEVPAYLPPPSVATGYVRMGRENPAPPQSNAYRETRGMGPSGKGGPGIGIPGTASEEAWLNVQGVTPAKGAK